MLLNQKEFDIRCKACNCVLSAEEIRRKAQDWDMCSECRYQSSRKFCASDKEYHHGQLTSISLDGSPLTVEVGHLSD